MVSVRKERFADIAAIETPDPATVVFKLKAVNASLLALWPRPSTASTAPPSSRRTRKYPETEIMGSGAFKFVEHVRGSHWTAKRFDGYFRKGLPYLDGYKAYFVKSNAVVPGMLGGQFDAEFRGQNPGERDQLLAKAKDSWVVHEGPWATVMLLIFNTTQEAVRRPARAPGPVAGHRPLGRRGSAVQDLDHEARRRHHAAGLASGRCREAELEKLPGYARDIEKSRAEAAQLLKEAGVENLNAQAASTAPWPSPTRPAASSSSTSGARSASPPSTCRSRPRPTSTAWCRATSTWRSGRSPSPPTIPPPSSTGFLTNKASPISYSRHTDTKLDEICEKQNRTLDPGRAQARSCSEADRYALNQAYTVPILWWNRIIVHHKKIKGWTMSPSHFQGTDLIDVWLDE